MINLTIANFKLLLRNRQSLFWSLAFPLIFTVIFGFFFGGATTSGGTIALVDQSSTPVAQSLDKAFQSQSVFKIKDAASVSDARNLISNGTASGALIIPADFGNLAASAPKTVTVLYDPGSAQTQAALEAFVTQYLTAINFQTLNAQPMFSFTQERANTSQDYSYFDFVLIGLVGMSLMNSSIQGVAIAMAYYRENKILKRITTTPLPSWQFISAEIISRLALNVIQVGLTLFVGIKFFHAHLTGNWLEFVAIALVGAILFQLIGFFISAVSKNSDTANSMGTAITVPMMFLSGVFFPIDNLPKWLYAIVQLLPLSPLLKMMREVGLQSINPFSTPSDSIIVGSWIVVLLIVSAYRFRMTSD
jgi:ABC-2 type transport system permease protein